VTAEKNFINRKITSYNLSLRMKDKNIHYTYFKIIYCSLFPFKEYAKDEVKET